MTTTTTTEQFKIIRRGFRTPWFKGKPEAQRNAALELAERAIAMGSEYPQERFGSTIVVEARPTAYCGPGSMGDRGAITIDLSGRIFGYALPDGTTCR